jgi:hypothetical protein
VPLAHQRAAWWAAPAAGPVQRVAGWDRAVVPGLLPSEMGRRPLGPAVPPPEVQRVEPMGRAATSCSAATGQERRLLLDIRPGLSCRASVDLWL